MDDREDIGLSAGIGLVLLYQEGEFYLRVLHRNAKPKATYLTRHMAVSLDALRKIARRSQEHFRWESEGMCVRTLNNGIVVYRLDSEFAMAMGSLTFMPERVTLFLRRLGLEFES